MFVFFLHVGSDLRLTDLLATDLRILIHCLTVCTDLSVRLKDLPRDAVKSSSKDPAEKSPDCQISKDGRIMYYLIDNTIKTAVLS